MKTLLLSGCFIAATLATTALALTINQQVTPAYVREHPKEWTVEATKGDDGLIHFVIKHSVEIPQYHVAHLAVYHQGKLMATSDTPLFGKKRGNTFYFSLAAEDIAESKFGLSDSALSGSGHDKVPVPGTTVYQFRLLDFVPKRLARPTTGG
jgi:hypothetical protein